jgi:hypothetical protein
MAQKRRHSPPPKDIFTSDTIIDRSSAFTAIYSPTLSARALQASSSVATATHRIAAWRVPSRQITLNSLAKFAGVASAQTQPHTTATTQLYDAGHDSDGEKGAGRRLEKVLADEGVEGSLVVGRWYGGVMLGPIRFTHIETAAREAVRSARNSESTQLSSTAAALKRARIISPRPGTPVSLSKRQVSEAAKLDTERKIEAMGLLRERDGNITVLRQLLEDKKSRLDGRSAVPVTPSKALNYAKMPYPSLKALEKVRDATIAFLLKELDKVENAQSEEDSLNAAFLAAEEMQGQQESRGAGRNEESEEDLSKRMERKRRRNEFEEDRQAWEMLDEVKRHGTT